MGQLNIIDHSHIARSSETKSGDKPIPTDSPSFSAVLVLCTCRSSTDWEWNCSSRFVIFCSRRAFQSLSFSIVALAASRNLSFNLHEPAITVAQAIATRAGSFTKENKPRWAVVCMSLSNVAITVDTVPRSVTGRPRFLIHLPIHELMDLWTIGYSTQAPLFHFTYQCGWRCMFIQRRKIQCEEEVVLLPDQ